MDDTRELPQRTSSGRGAAIRHRPTGLRQRERFSLDAGAAEETTDPACRPRIAHAVFAVPAGYAPRHLRDDLPDTA